MCKENVNIFLKNGKKKKKIILGPIKEANVPKASKEEGKSLRIVNSEDKFDKEAREFKQVYVVVVTDGEPKKVTEILVVIQPLINEFEELLPDKLPASLPPIRDIQHCINLVHGDSSSNLPHYQMNPQEDQILQG